MPESVNTNTVLKELQGHVKANAALQERYDKMQGTINGLRTRQDRIGQEMYNHSNEMQKLMKIADVVSPGWREWPWVKEAGFVKMLPVMRDVA